MPKAKAMLEVEVLDGAAVGEVVKAEAGVDRGHPRRQHLRRHLLLLRRAVMLGTRRWSLFCSCVGRRTVAFAFPGRSRGCWRSTSHRS